MINNLLHLPAQNMCTHFRNIGKKRMIPRGR